MKLTVYVIEQCFWYGARRRPGTTLEIETDDLAQDARGVVVIPRWFERDPVRARARLNEIASRAYRGAVESAGKGAEIHSSNDPRKHHV